MKERLVSNGWVDIGGCKCMGGARYYVNKMDFPFVRIDDFYKKEYLILKVNGQRKEVYKYQRVNSLFNDIEKYRNEESRTV